MHITNKLHYGQMKNLTRLLKQFYRKILLIRELTPLTLTELFYFRENHLKEKAKQIEKKISNLSFQDFFLKRNLYCSKRT